MFAQVYGLPVRQLVAQSLRAHPVFPLLDARPWPAAGSGLPVGDGRPRLLVGRAQTERLLGVKLKPLDSRLDEHTWWCYAPEEDVSYFVRQFEAFLKEVPRGLLSGVSWRGYDPLVHGPATAAGLRELLRAGTNNWVVYEHRSGWSWWDPQAPHLVQGLQVGPYYAHTGISWGELRQLLQARAARYVVEGKPKRVSAWFETRFGYEPSEVVRMAPWLVHLKEEKAYLGTEAMPVPPVPVP